MGRNERSLRLEWLEAFLKGRDIPYYARKIAGKLLRPVVIVSTAGRVLAFHDPSGSGFVPGDFSPPLAFGRDWGKPALMTCAELPRTCGKWPGRGKSGEIEYLAVPLVAENRYLGSVFILGQPVLTAEEEE